MAGFCINSKGRSFIRGKSIDDSLRGSIVDWIIAEGGGSCIGLYKILSIESCCNESERSTADEVYS